MKLAPLQLGLQQEGRGLPELQVSVCTAEIDAHLLEIVHVSMLRRGGTRSTSAPAGPRLHQQVQIHACTSRSL